MYHIKSLGKDIKIYEYTCSNCNSTIEYTENEIKESGNWTRTGMEESIYNGYKYVICPICKNEHKIKPILEFFY